MESITHLARKAIQALVPYSSARLESNPVGIQLDANENPFEKEFGFNRYPQPQPPALKQKLAQRYGVNPSQLMITRGSDEGIDLLVRVFCEANCDSILITPPTYGMYEVAANIQGAGIQTVALIKEKEFALNPEAIVQQWKPGVKLVFLCSPNNPTGNVFYPEDILSLCAQLQNRAIVVIDEAYVEFSTQDSLAAFVNQFPNLVVLRTLSKAFGLAGVRVGSLIANEELIALFLKVLAPYPIPLPVEMAALSALQCDHLMRVDAQIGSIRQQRDQLKSFLEKHPEVEKIYSSHANFLLVRVQDAASWLSTCKKNQILIRSRDKIPGLQNCVRITIGTPLEMERLKEVLVHV